MRSAYDYGPIRIFFLNSSVLLNGYALPDLKRLKSKGNRSSRKSYYYILQSCQQISVHYYYVRPLGLLGTFPAIYGVRDLIPFDETINNRLSLRHTNENL